MELSRALAKYSLDLSFEKIPDDVKMFTKLCILDYFGSAFAGSNKPPVQMISELINEMGGEKQATLLTGGRSSVLNAALVNGAASHIVELDDIHKASIIHAATVVIPAALAVAEWKKLSGEDLITAVVIGYEVCYRIGEAVSPSHYYYWHNTATCGTFGAAAAAAKLLDLNEEEFIYALGNAGTQAAGLWEFIEDGAMTKQLHPGKAAMNGVMAVLLAKKGFTGASKILEGNRGFFKAMSEEYNEGKITEALGEKYKIVENSFKIHASCRHTHHAVDLLIEMLHERETDPSEIESVIVRTYQAAIDITDNNDPQTQYASKFSLQFCSALALIKGSANLDDFNDSSLWNNETRQLMKKVSVVLDPEINAAYPEKWGAGIEVHYTNGDIVELKTDFPKGDPENPVSAKDLLEKYRNLARDLPEEKRERIAADILALESIGDMTDLLKDFSSSLLS
ncbi:MmgE/PrpD family protein [Jeotgalibacillus soli]|uniref:MmgE/PrpD family protein n=1 Tax=Jeotgalibacillus soli TaxID=889306 RepID=A0A0C2VMB2_9BACL|nr:MmgE/PrpD family protein [Jeotgalibacillus soli]KIL45148.1 hypothetical protein KP78_26920 [Jeotgalibacillus soli]